MLGGRGRGDEEGGEGGEEEGGEGWWEGGVFFCCEVAHVGVWVGEEGVCFEEVLLWFVSVSKHGVLS